MNYKKNKIILRTILWMHFLFFAAILESCTPEFARGLQQDIIHIGGVPLKAEIVATPETRQKGLMYREKLDEDSGMLFVFPATRYQSFWMKNTFIPLDVGFFDDQGFLLQVIAMEPDNGKKIHTSIEPAKYALEVNQGWFKRNNLRRYAKLELNEPVSGL